MEYDSPPPVAAKRRNKKYLVIGTYDGTRKTTYDFIAAPSADKAEELVRRARDPGDTWEPVATYVDTELMETAIELRISSITEIRKGWADTKSMLR